MVPPILGNPHMTWGLCIPMMPTDHQQAERTAPQGGGDPTVPPQEGPFMGGGMGAMKP